MLTTASITFSATSAMASGPRACEGIESAGSAMAAAAATVKAGRKKACVRAVRRAMTVKSPEDGI